MFDIAARVHWYPFVQWNRDCEGERIVQLLNGHIMTRGWFSHFALDFPVMCLHFVEDTRKKKGSAWAQLFFIEQLDSCCSYPFNPYKSHGAAQGLKITLKNGDEWDIIKERYTK